jgi:hypothetical protein
MSRDQDAAEGLLARLQKKSRDIPDDEKGGKGTLVAGCVPESYEKYPLKQKVAPGVIQQKPKKGGKR